MANTYATTLAALGTPQLDYIMDETSGDFVNNGDGGTVNLVHDLGQVSNPLYESPGLIRNAPFEYGYWDLPQSGSTLYSAGAGAAGMPAVAGWTTGVFSCFVLRFSEYDGGNWDPFALHYRSGTSLSVATGAGFQMESDGRLWFTIAADKTTSPGSQRITWRSDATGIMVLANAYHLVATQRGDGTGLHVFVNGVEIAGTTYLGTSATNDTFMDAFDNLTFSTAGPMVVNGRASGIISSFSAINAAHSIVQRPTVWRNNGGFSDSQILALYLSANLFGEPQDYYEYMLDRWVVGNSPTNFGRAFTMFLGGSTSSAETSGQDTGNAQIVDAHRRFDIGGTPVAVNQTETDRTSVYPLREIVFGDGSGQVAFDADDLADDAEFSTGTMQVLISLGSTIDVTDIAGLFGYGEGTTVDDENIMFWLGGTDFGTTLIYSIGQISNFVNDKSGDFYQQVYQASDGGFTLGDFPVDLALITLVQDGTGIKVYRDNTLLTTFFPTSSGTTYDEDSFSGTLPQMGALSSPRFALGYPGSATQRNGTNNDLAYKQVFIAPAPMTQVQIAEMWDAINGIFAPPTSPPTGGFNDTLVNTGNDGDPNGPGPDHYWRMNSLAVIISDIGISTTIGTSIAEGGDPTFQTQGPLINDPTNAAIYFDGAGDYFEIGVDFVTGRLVTDAIGTVGFFVSLNSFTTENIVYSQADATGAERISFGVNAGKPEIFVQTSAGNSVRYTATNAFENFDYVFVVITNDGTDYKIYIDCVEDTTAVLDTEGTGAEGDWFDTISGATRSAVGALATSGFLTETTARFSELFIYDEVLTEGQICALFEAAVQDGINTSANLLGVLQFEDVLFRNGGAADVRAINPRTDFNQIVKIDACRFVGGAQGAAAQSVLLSGETRAQIEGATFDLNETPVAGRAAVHATVADPTASATTFGSLIVRDSTFNRMGRAADPVLYLEAGFGMTADKNRFFDSLGSAIGWRGDARRVNVRDNLIDTITSGLAGIYVRAGLNTQIGTAWNIQRNTILDVAVGDGILIEGANSSSAEFARNIRIAKNLINTVASEYINLHQIQDASVENNQCADGAVDGIVLRSIAGVVALKGNSVQNHTGEGISASEASLQTVLLELHNNTVNGVASADGITVNNISSLVMTDNDLVNLVNGLTLGTIGTLAKVRGNNFNTVTTPLVLSGTQAGLDFGDNSVENLAALQALTVAAEAVNVSGPYHTLTSGSITNLTDIGGVHSLGKVLILLLATGSSQITLVDGADLILNGNFVMDDAGTDNIWLVSDGADWVELDRRGTA